MKVCCQNMGQAEVLIIAVCRWLHNIKGGAARLPRTISKTPLPLQRYHRLKSKAKYLCFISSYRALRGGEGWACILEFHYFGCEEHVAKEMAVRKRSQRVSKEELDIILVNALCHIIYLNYTTTQKYSYVIPMQSVPILT